MRLAAALSLSLSLSCLCCAVVRDDAAALLARGRPVEALSLLDESRPGPSATTRDRARHALLLGLAWLGVGDPLSARRSLDEARALLLLDERSLTPDERARLDDAWWGLPDDIRTR